jgi:STAS-like domain of unknown function (DUF4325)
MQTILVLIKIMKIKIATDFSQAPGPRYIKEGKFSGEEFRTKHLLPRLKAALEAKCNLEVDLDGTAGFGTSFLEETFGGLIREDKFDINTINSTIKLISNEEPGLLDEIKEYLEDAANDAKR